MEIIILKVVWSIIAVLFAVVILFQLSALHFAWKHRNEQWFKDASRRLKLGEHRHGNTIRK